MNADSTTEQAMGKSAMNKAFCAARGIQQKVQCDAGLRRPQADNRKRRAGQDARAACKRPVSRIDSEISDPSESWQAVRPQRRRLPLSLLALDREDAMASITVVAHDFTAVLRQGQYVAARERFWAAGALRPADQRAACRRIRRSRQDSHAERHDAASRDEAPLISAALLRSRGFGLGLCPSHGLRAELPSHPDIRMLRSNPLALQGAQAHAVRR